MLLTSSNNSARLGSHRYFGSEDKKFLIHHLTSLYHVFKRLCNLMGRISYRSHHFAKSSSHRPFGSSDTATKIVYVTLEDHVIKKSGDFMEWNSSLYILTLPKFIAIDIALMYIEIIQFIT